MICGTPIGGRSSSFLLLCSFRPERQSPAWRVKQTAETDYPHRYTEIALSPLSDEDSDVLFGNLLGISDAPPQLRQIILAKTEGNPFFVEEFIRTLIDTDAIARDENGLHWRADARVEDIPIPENLQALLTSRIDRLEEDTRRTLQLSSVIGRSFYRRVLEQISDSTTALDRRPSTLQRAELIREEARVPELEYMFRHDLTREAAYSRSSSARVENSTTGSVTRSKRCSATDSKTRHTGSPTISTKRLTTNGR